MKRRAILVAGGACLLALSMRSLAQAPKAPRRIALVHPGTQDGFRREFDVFRTALTELGNVEGKDISSIARADELERSFNELAQRKAEALIVTNLSLVASLRQQLVERTLKARLPLLSINPYFAETGGLLSYGTSTDENWRRAAAMVDKILRGAKPGELPVEQPERFLLVVNMKTAKAIGVSLSPATMLRADKVIE